MGSAWYPGAATGFFQRGSNSTYATKNLENLYFKRVLGYFGKYSTSGGHGAHP